MGQSNEKELISGIFLRRYKRFFADFKLSDGSELTAHCPNPGRMTSCAEEGWISMLSKSSNPKRKLPCTWEMIHNGKSWIGVNTGRANQIVADALHDGRIPELKLYPHVKREVRAFDSRIDFCLEDSNLSKKCYLEVKSVSYLKDGDYFFPDAVTARGKKHLETLSLLVKQGHRSVIFFVVQRSDGQDFRIAEHIDPAYAEAMKAAVRTGVEIMAWQCSVRPGLIFLEKRISVPEYD